VNPEHASTSTVESFEAFRRLVLAEPALQARLRSIREWPPFVDAVVDTAAQYGITLTEADVLAARDASRRSWLERWI